MKKWLVLLIIIATSWWWLSIRGAETNIVPAAVVSPTPTSILGLAKNEDKLVPLVVNGANFRITWTLVSDMSLIVVGVNEALASSSGDIRDSEACNTLTSGGFYGKNDLPIGMVVSNSTELSPWQENILFNGVLGWNEAGLSIESSENLNNVWAIQAGPVLYRDGQPVKLQLKNDQSARRIIAGVTVNGQLLLVAVVAEDSLFGGPRLAELPEIVLKIEEAVGIKLVSAINLDGGTASAFLSEEVGLKELKPIGSWICVK